MRRFVLLMTGAVIASLCLWVGSASSQTDPTTTTIVAAPEETTTTAAAGDPTTTTQAPTTTAAVAPTTTIDWSTIPLPGKAVTSGRLGLDLQFKDHPEVNCNTSLDVAGGGLNIVDDADGNVGAAYGLVKTDATNGRAGVLMIKLGALPAAVAVVSITGPCNLDTVGIGAYDGGTDYAKFDGVGAGVRSDNIGEGLFVEHMRVSTTIGGTSDTANLDLHQVDNFVMRPRS